MHALWERVLEVLTLQFVPLFFFFFWPERGGEVAGCGAAKSQRVKKVIGVSCFVGSNWGIIRKDIDADPDPLHKHDMIKWHGIRFGKILQI